MEMYKFRPLGIRFLILAIWITPAYILLSQSQITFRQLSVKEGLSQNSAISITQDSTGYLWIATQDGLNRYDGRQFTVFPYTFVDITKPDYSNLGKIYNDRQGDLWIIPMNKVPHKFNFENQVFEPVPRINDASVIYQDTALNIWIGTYSEGLYVLRPGKKIPELLLSADEINGTIYNLIQDNKNDLVLAADGKILEFDPNTKEVNQVRPKIESSESILENFSDIVLDNNGRQWISTFGNGLYFREKESSTLLRISEMPFSDPLPVDLNITDLYADSKNRLWVATYGRGLYLIDFNNTEIVHFGAEKYNPKALHYNDVLCVYEDYSGTLWFGTDGAGVSYYDEYLEKFNSLTNYETPENINIDVVRAIAVDKNNLVWIGTSGKGLTRYEPISNSWLTLKAEANNQNTISSNRIMSLLVDGSNDLWIGTQGGGLNIKSADGQVTRFSPDAKKKLSANTVWSIYNDEDDRIWLGTREEGLIEFDKTKGEVRKYLHDPQNENSLPSNNIRTITSDGKGNLWIGSEAHGISLFDIKNNTFTNYRQGEGENSISNDNIKSLYFDLDGLLWIGTSGGGLNVFDTKSKKFRAYTVEDGLANNVIYAILADEDKNLWLSSNKGISKFMPGNIFESVPKVKNYTNYAGLATEFNTGAYHKDAEGNLYFGGLDGFYWFKPDAIKENTFLPKTTITGFTMFDKPQALSDGRELQYNENTVSFTFSSLQFALPEKNQFQYRLRNYDDGWVQSGNNNFARYTQLPPGDYRFQVKSSNYDGAWNETPVNYSFSITPPWYLTTLAKMLYLLLLFAVIYGVYSYLKWRLQMRLDLQLKDEETLRLKKLNDLKSKLYTDISHEFRTPLTLISGPVDAKLSEGGLSDTDFSNFSMIKRNTNRLVALVDQLLHLAKLEKGKLKLNIIEGNLGLFLGMLATSFEYRATLKKMKYSVSIEGTLEQAFYDADALEKIVTNLLSNALKYGRVGGTCQFEAREIEDYLRINVKNSVVEQTDIDLDKLFHRFYQKDEFAEGAGIGLSLVKELVQLCKGAVTVNLEAGDIINFQVELPITDPKAKRAKSLETSDGEESSLATVEVKSEGLLSKTPKDMAEPDELPLVLIVEDHKEVRDFLKSVWKNNYRIYEASDGKKGLEKALKLVPDLVISDIRMPVLDGIELCNRLKGDERTSHIPVILLTAGVDEDYEMQGLQSGADDFVTKPFKLKVLQTRVENLIESRKALRNRYSQELILQAKDIAVTPTDTIFLNRLQQVLDDHLAKPDFNTEFFCREIGMSRMQLHRKLLAFTGLSTTAFIRSQRLKQALHILKTSDASVSEVAYTVGFNTPSYFIKCFKETYNKTPSEFLQAAE